MSRHDEEDGPIHRVPLECVGKSDGPGHHARLEFVDAGKYGPRHHVLLEFVGAEAAAALQALREQYHCWLSRHDTEDVPDYHALLEFVDAGEYGPDHHALLECACEEDGLNHHALLEVVGAAAAAALQALREQYH